MFLVLLNVLGIVFKDVITFSEWFSQIDTN